MGKRPRTPHFITGIGDGNVNLADSHAHGVPSDDLFVFASSQGRHGNKKNANDNNRYVRTRNERLSRLEEPLLASDHWRDVFGSGDPALGKPTSTLSGPWQVSAFAILGMVVVISAIFLHLVSESSSSSGDSSSETPYYAHSSRRRQRHARRMYKTRKKKTDEWSDDEEPLQNGASIPDSPHEQQDEPAQFYPHYYHQPSAANTRFSTQDHRQRRTTGAHKDHSTSPHASSGRAGGSNYYLPATTSYKSPSAMMLGNTPPGRVHLRGTSPASSYNSGSQPQGQSPSGVFRATTTALGNVSSASSSHHAMSPSMMRATAPLSGRLRVPTPPDARDIFQQVVGVQTSGGSPMHILPTNPEEAHLPEESQCIGAATDLKVRPLNASNVSSFASLGSTSLPLDTRSHNSKASSKAHSATPSSQDSIGFGQILDGSTSHSQSSTRLQLEHSMSHSSRHQQSLLLSPGNYEVETPIIGNARRFVGTSGLAAGLPDLGTASEPPLAGDDELPTSIPYIPALDAANHQDGYSPQLHAATPPPRSVDLDELRLVQMETGNMHWEVKEPSEIAVQDVNESQDSFYTDENFTGTSLHFGEYGSSSEDGDSNISIPSGDPRKSIIHKRSDLTMATDAATSLLSSISFEELKLQEVIGGGGFGQVWRATWRGTPVAVKVLTGSAQNKHIAKAILEEFKAEINLLKGMRHPNICLYMGACVQPPNRAIVTELAANGSVWDALRLPLMPPYTPADGTQEGAWPSYLYTPDRHGAPPSDHRRLAAPIPPRGTWPWQLVKRVACGAARGMAYLHSGNPPVLHRDLKSANLLLDDSYTAKVCDFGLSRLKAQERSMTGNCGTVQWMAPEVLANMSYNEKADVFSFGIILWELLSRECPYDGMTAIQCALAVLNRDKRPDIPKWCPPSLHALIKSCVKKEPDQRPSFAQIILALDSMD